MNTKKCLKKLIKNADAIVIGAGAGLSSSAGIDYSKESFQKNFKELVEAYGMTDMYTSSFYEFKTEEERWAYWAKHINYSFIKPPALKAYQDLFDLVKDKNYFVITTNVDGQFVKSGFDKNRVFEVQGSYGKMQCINACHNKVYDDTKLVKEMLKYDLKIPKSLIPKCPVCGKNMDINIRKNDNFVEDSHWNKQNKRYNKFINENKNILLLELGVGFNTPSIIRFPFENLVYYKPNSYLIRVNEKYDYVPQEIKDKSLSFKMDIKEFINMIKS